MLLQTVVTCTLLLLVGASPGLESNLNFRSPYTNQPGLALDTKSIHDRHTRVARSALRKRQAQEVRPSGHSSNYNYVGYGLGVASWNDADYIYAGSINFTHSIASGDPYDTSVILLTRIEPTDDWRIDLPLCAEYKVYSGLNATGEVVSSGYALTNADVDFTLKGEATGLQAGSWYSYQFSNCAKPEEKSPIGRTKTAPGWKASHLETQRFSIYSCSFWNAGFFSAYSGPVIHQDTDYVVHLGDYIYEAAGGGQAINRTASKGKECATLDDYRKRYAQHRTDIDLVSMHEQFPLIAIWDDHETADNDWKAGSSDSNDSVITNGCKYSNGSVCFSDRATHAKRAYHEWIPIRSVDIDDEARIWREFNFGNLVDIFALDTRKYNRDITDVGYNRAVLGQIALDTDTRRTMTGKKQEKWFLDGIKYSQKKGTQWRMVLNQVIFGSYDSSVANPAYPKVNSSINYDAWDGYQGQRKRIVDYVYDEDIDNVALFTGDSHANWLFEINRDSVLSGSANISTLKQIRTTENKKQRGQMVEYGVTAISSSGWGMIYNYGTGANATTASKREVEIQPGLMYSEGFYRGYIQAEVNYTHLVTTYYGYPGNELARVPYNRTMGARFVQQAGHNQLQRPLQQPTADFGAVKPGNF